MCPSQPKQRLVPHGTKSRDVLPFALMAFDPGGTTGWSLITCEGGMSDQLTIDDFKLTVGELGPHEHHAELAELLNHMATLYTSYAPSYKIHIATESFTFRQFATDESFGKAKVELISCEYIGILKLFAEVNHYPIASWMSSEGIGFVPDHKLEALGWFQTPKTPKRHINDSLRIGVSYLVKKLRIHSPITDAWRD